ncbi:MAG: DUF3099 domain-containing protein [Nocardioidaceae bacterium]
MVQADPNPVSITTARRGRSADIHSREVRYLVSMGIRTVCFLCAVVVGGPLRWVFIAAALILPYIAVVFANAAGGRSAQDDAEPYTPTFGELEQGGSALPEGHEESGEDPRG